MVTATVEIHLKPGVTDPEGENVAKALRLLGFGEVRTVHAVKAFVLELEGADKEAARARLEEMCERLLANPVIHKYVIKVEEPKPLSPSMPE